MSTRNKILVGILIFLVSYPVFLLVWIYLKPYYGTLINGFGSRLAAWSMDVTMEKIESGKELSKITFAKPVLTKDGLQDLLLDLNMSVSVYAFNIPLTFALIVSLLPFFHWRKRSYLEAGVILVAVHVLFVFSFCCVKIYMALIKTGLAPRSGIQQFILEFLWSFTDNLIIRFEPFLMIVYLWLRNAYRRTGTDPRASEKAGG